MSAALTLFERALELHATGRDEEAKQAYVDVLRNDDTHLGALTNLGTLLFNTGYRTAARTAYRRAAEYHPHDLMARVNFANALYDNAELSQALEQYQAALHVDASCPEAHQGVANVLERLGDEAAAARHRDLGFRPHATTIVPYRGTNQAVPVLLLVSALGGNVNVDGFLDDRIFSTTKLFAEHYDPHDPLPPHAFIFNAIGEADLCARALDNAQRLLAHTAAPVINPPAAVRESGRARNAARLAHIPGVVAPLTLEFQREILTEPNAAETLAQHGFRWPLLLRSAGYHTGHHFVMLASPEHLAAGVDALPGTRLLAIEFLDARSPDTNVRKYRVMIVDGELFPLHLAISPEWKVHYFSAKHELPEHRAEEQAFLDDMPGALGPDALNALERIAQTLGLDYAGIDFALDAHRNVQLFEANATMLVPPPSHDPRFAYRAAAVERIHAAVRSMLATHAGAFYEGSTSSQSGDDAP